MRRAWRFGSLIALAMLLPTGQAVQQGCVEPDLTNAPFQTRVQYDLAECGPIAVLDGRDGEAPPVIDDVASSAIIIVGVPIGNGGVCLIADPRTAGSLFLDIEHSCNEDPCKVLPTVLDPIVPAGDPCHLDPCVLDQATCDLGLVMPVSTGRMRAIGSAPGEGASL